MLAAWPWSAGYLAKHTAKRSRDGIKVFLVSKIRHRPHLVVLTDRCLMIFVGENYRIGLRSSLLTFAAVSSLILRATNLKHKFLDAVFGYTAFLLSRLGVWNFSFYLGIDQLFKSQ